MIELLNSWRDAPNVPQGWEPRAQPGALVKQKIANRRMLSALRLALPGVWRKVYHYGKDGSEVHYCQHSSGKVAFVKHKPKL